MESCSSLVSSEEVSSALTSCTAEETVSFGHTFAGLEVDEEDLDTIPWPTPELDVVLWGALVCGDLLRRVAVQGAWRAAGAILAAEAPKPGEEICHLPRFSMPFSIPC